jgi:hypothetical protein
MATANKTQTQARPATAQTKATSAAPTTRASAAPAPASAPVQTAKPAAPVVEQSKQVAVPISDDLMSMLEQSKGGGFEEATVDAFATPFLVILQDLSPQTKSLMPGYIEGAKPGQIMQSVSQELFSEIEVIPCYFSRVFIEWVSRAKGGGLVAIHPADTPLASQIVRDEKNQPVLPNGHTLEDTRQHYVLFKHSSGQYIQCLIAMKSTQIKRSKRWMAAMSSALPHGTKLLNDLPSYACSYKLRVEAEANEQGQWFSWVAVERALITDVEVFRRAKAFNESVKRGQTRANYEDLRATETGAAQSGSDVPEDLDNEIDA